MILKIANISLNSIIKFKMSSRNIILCQFTIIILCLGCKENNISYPTKVEGIETYYANRGITIDWLPVDIQEFEYYEVLRSIDNQNFYSINSWSSDSSKYDINYTTYTDISYPFVGILYYKIRAYGYEVMIESDVDSIEVSDPLKLNIKPDYYSIMPEEKKIIFSNLNGIADYHYLYDYSKNIFEDSIKLNTVTTDREVGLVKYNGNYEFYFYAGDFNSKMLIFDALTFNYKSSFEYDDIDYTLIPVVISNKSYYYDSFYLYILNRETSEITTYNFSSAFGKVFYIESTNKFIRFGINNDYTLFDISSEGLITSETSYQLKADFNYDYINGTKFIIGGNIIIDLETGDEYQISDEDSNPIYFSIIHTAKGILYGYVPQRIYCYRMTNFELIEYFPTRIEATQILSDDEDLIIIQNKYADKVLTIDKMALSK